jgi:uncharacterized protein YndB with AHSA1/START domain
LKNYQCDILLGAAVSTVYEALTTQKGICGWWTASSQTGTAVGETITIRFGTTFKVMRIENLRPDAEVRWCVIDAQLDVPGLTRTQEWIGTYIVFKLEPQSSSVTRLQMEHIGLTPEIECYEICCRGWTQFLGSLKNYVETGIGAPYVDPPA